MNAFKIICPIVSLTFLAACGNPADNVPAASVSSTATNTTASAETNSSAGPAKIYSINSKNSKVSFVGSKVTGSHDGGFTNVNGTIKVVDGKVADKGTKVIIDTTSIWSDNDRLTGHLKSADFFDTAQHPTATFETISISGQGTNTTVTGNLTMHGEMKQISFPASIQVSDDKVDVEAQFSINRFDFNMKYPGKADDLIRQEVVLKLDVEATPEI